ncbi:MAG: 2-amino-4-hydroxy-6-hydroxymethyldihydropteridine diphosphokinase [Lentisphaeria bacterium]|nr:2-amino-4-hydroxy-6-hydroxymethyldihydropteridine diphosphokinase [Lentisphaeria bacterium]
MFLAIGSNKGDRETLIRGALEGLRSGGFEVKELSPLYETSPVDCEEGTPSFLNGVIRGFWRETPESLLNLCQGLERRAGRPEKHSSRQSRELDLDIIIFGQKIIRTERLTIPHPRAAKRSFVLVPLHDLSPEAIFPDCGKTVAELLKNLPGSTGIEPYQH